MISAKILVAIAAESAVYSRSLPGRCHPIVLQNKRLPSSWSTYQLARRRTGRLVGHCHGMALRDGAAPVPWMPVSVCLCAVLGLACLTCCGSVLLPQMLDVTMHELNCAVKIHCIHPLQFYYHHQLRLVSSSSPSRL
jgi:hypothetical protein